MFLSLTHRKHIMHTKSVSVYIPIDRLRYIMGTLSPVQFQKKCRQSKLDVINAQPAVSISSLRGTPFFFFSLPIRPIKNSEPVPFYLMQSKEVCIVLIDESCCWPVSFNAFSCLHEVWTENGWFHILRCVLGGEWIDREFLFSLRITWQTHICLPRQTSCMYPTMRISNISSFVPWTVFHIYWDELAGPDSRTLVKVFGASQGKRLKGEYNLCWAVAPTLKKQMI